MWSSNKEKVLQGLGCRSADFLIIYLQNRHLITLPLIKGYHHIGVFMTLPNIYVGAFCKNSLRLSGVIYFRKKPLHLSASDYIRSCDFRGRGLNRFGNYFKYFWLSHNLDKNGNIKSSRFGTNSLQFRGSFL